MRIDTAIGCNLIINYAVDFVYNIYLYFGIEIFVVQLNKKPIAVLNLSIRV